MTHDLGLAWNVADRIAVMYLGRIVELGPAEELLEDPRHPYTRALLSVVPEAKRVDEEILVGEAPDPTLIPSGCRFHTRCPIAADICARVEPALQEFGGGRLAACHFATVEAGGGQTDRKGPHDLA